MSGIVFWSAVAVVLYTYAIQHTTAAIAVLLVQVITSLAAVQLQSLASVPPRVRAPLVTLIPAGNTSTTVIVPLVVVLPSLDTLNE